MLDHTLARMPGMSIKAIAMPMMAPRCFIALAGFTMPSMSPKAVRMIAMVASNPKRLTQPRMKSGPFMVLRTFS
jgi:hypothetical protein